MGSAERRLEAYRSLSSMVVVVMVVVVVVVPVSSSSSRRFESRFFFLWLGEEFGSVGFGSMMSSGLGSSRGGR